MKTALWIVGEPGTGKTTLARALMGPLGQYRRIAKPKWMASRSICAAGHYTGGTFDGADTVPYNGVQASLDFWREMLSDRDLTIFDGDRFSNARSVDFFRDKPPRVVCILLEGDQAELEARRLARAQAAGRDPQNPTWVAGRRTKAARFHDLDWDAALRLDATELDPDQVVDRARAFLA